MSYLDDFNARINVAGNSIANSQFHSTQKFIESNFANSPMYRVVQVNGVNLEVQLQDISSVTRSANVSLVQFTLKFMLLKPNTSVNIGDIVAIKDEQTQIVVNWIVSDFISDNPLFPKAKIEKCNFELQVKTGETKILCGYDDFRAPVYDITPTFATMQSILRNTIGNIALNSEINLPSERMLISITYNDTSKLIKENDTFDMYGREYKVIGIDFSNVHSDKGIITLTTERVVNK
jgi:hypothetical protein